MAHKNLIERGLYTFYISKDFVPIFQEFIDLLKKDKDIIRLQKDWYKNQLISLGIRQAIKNYVLIRKIKLSKQIEDQYETPN